MDRFMMEVKAARGTSPTGEFEAILSAPTIDRDGEVIDPRAFEPLPSKIKIFVDHDASVRSIAGIGVPYYEGDLLKVRGTFSSSPFGQEIREAVVGGFVDTMSVGFANPKKNKVEGVDHIYEAELLEASFVGIPSNRQALVLSAKAGATISKENLKRLQSIHDLVCELGAGCKVEQEEEVEEIPKAVNTIESKLAEIEELKNFLHEAS